MYSQVPLLVPCSLLEKVDPAGSELTRDDLSTRGATQWDHLSRENNLTAFEHYSSVRLPQVAIVADADMPFWQLPGDRNVFRPRPEFAEDAFVLLPAAGKQFTFKTPDEVCDLPISLDPVVLPDRLPASSEMMVWQLDFGSTLEAPQRCFDPDGGWLF